MLYLDGTLLVAFLLLLSPRMTGLPIHEWLGISFGAPLLLHLLLSWRWIVAAVTALPSGSRRMRINFVINAALFTLVVIEIVSGLVISRVALPFIGVHTIEDRSWRALHNQSLNFTMAAVGLHIAMNWRWIVTAFARRSASRDGRMHILAWLPSAARRAGAILFAAALIGAAAYAFLGQPSPRREYRQDEIARFRPGVAHGIGQFAGETFLVALVAYAGKRWLRLRV